MMLSAGSAEQLAIWISQGRPEIQMFEYDIRRFVPSVIADRALVTEQSFESYGKNYSIVFPHDQPLAGRNHKIDVFHEVGNIQIRVHMFKKSSFYLGSGGKRCSNGILSGLGTPWILH